MLCFNQHPCELCALKLYLYPNYILDIRHVVINYILIKSLYVYSILLNLNTLNNRVKNQKNLIYLLFLLLLYFII